MFVAKWLHAIPSCSSMGIIGASYVVTHLHNLLSWPNLYIIPFFNVNGFVVANLYFSLWVNGLDIYLVYKKNLTSFNQIGYIWDIVRCIHNLIRYSHGFCGVWQSRNIFMNLSKYSLKVWLISNWWSLFIPKGITTHVNVPQFVIRVRINSNKPKLMSKCQLFYNFYYICLCSATLMACESWKVVLIE